MVVPGDDVVNLCRPVFADPGDAELADAAVSCENGLADALPVAREAVASS